MEVASGVDNLNKTLNYKFANLGSLKDFFLMLAPTFAIILCVYASIYAFSGSSRGLNFVKVVDDATDEKKQQCKTDGGLNDKTKCTADCIDYYSNQYVLADGRLNFAYTLTLLFIGFAVGGFAIEYMLKQ